MSFSLLLRELSPPPTRQRLEEISVHVPGVARADCAGFLEHWFGIVSSNLTRTDALAFQNALRAAGYETDIVEDYNIPALHSDFRCQRIAIDNQILSFTDALGRRWNKTRQELVFIAAGCIQTPNAAAKKCFRIDLFFSNDPHRISLQVNDQGVVFYDERPIRLKNSLDLTVLMVDLHLLLPSERMNSGLRGRSMDFLYPTIFAYEEEIRWAFYRLGAKG